MSTDSIQTGQMPLQAPLGQFDSIAFMVQQSLAKMQTATLVRIESCTNSGSLSSVGFVDVTPLVNQIDSQGNATSHTVIHNIPYFRLQGGSNAIILDPQVGDIGICVFASRDISKIKITKSQANPGSYRQYNFSDGLYIGGLLNGTPSQYVQFNSSGIKIHSPTSVVIEGPVVQITAGTSCTITTPTFTVNGNSVLNGTVNQTGGGAAVFSGSMNVAGDVVANGTSVHTHIHSGVVPGGGNTGVPV